MSEPHDQTTLRTGDVPQIERERRVALVFYHRDGATAVSLRLQAPLVVGRAAPSNVVLSAPRLSRRHASFVWESEGVFVEDLGSTNGTFVDGERVERLRLSDGDEVSFGGVVAVLQTVTDGAPIAGADSDDLFVAIVEHEVGCARHFHRPLSVAMVRAVRADRRHVGAWLPLLRRHLSAVDRVATFGHEAVMLLLPNLTRDEAAARLDQAFGRARQEGVVLVAGLASVPGDGANAHELIAHARQTARSAKPGARLVDGANEASDDESVEMVVESEAMREVSAVADRVAPAELPVLLTGETGSGKEVLARHIHGSSPRHKAALVAVNCATIPPTLLESTLFGHVRGAFTGADEDRAGLFSQADEGTIFLDEVGELAPQAQAALLRVLETKLVRPVGGNDEHEVDVRLIAATHRDLEGMCETGEFRWDLYFRIAAITIVVPPLRDRREEIEALATLFLESAARRNSATGKQLSAEAVAALRAYAFPGNVRELKNAMERAAVLAEGEEVTLGDLPGRMRAEAPTARVAQEPSRDDDERPEEDTSLDFRARAAAFEKRVLLQTLTETNGNQSEAARRLGLPRRTLVHKIKLHGIKKSYNG